MAITVRVTDVAKRYRLGPQHRYRTIRETIVQAVTAPFCRRTEPRDVVWALDGVSFDIEEGEVVGIIGRNGAGKSTLLKILARITEPTRGEAAVRGRIGSLLEAGTGFHPELTGRENIFLAAAILGMKRAEIIRKFDAIVDFAGVDQFVDTQIKHYSTGMVMRLGFAVAAHLEPEILVIDEILAVGDASFQKRCLGRVETLARGGRTVLFVSHQLNAVRAICSRVFWLSDGRLIADGDPAATIARYLSGEGALAEWRRVASDPRLDNAFFKPLRFAVVDRSLRVLQGPIPADADIGVLIEGDITSPNPALTVGFALSTVAGDLLFWSVHTDEHPDHWPMLSKDRNTLVAWIPPHLLNEGDYTAELIVSLHNNQWLSQPGADAPSVSFGVRGGLSESPHWTMARPGLLAPVLHYSTVELSASHG